MSTSSYRLPRSLTPLDYDVAIEASPRRKSFSGSVVLTAAVHQGTSSLDLHAHDLSLTDIQAQSGRLRQKGRLTYFPEEQRARIAFEKALPTGRLRLKIAFRGKLSTNMSGLYLAQDGRDRAVVSQCQATSARAIFPCLDEPDLKATIKWTVTTDAGLAVITNGALQRKERGDQGREVHRFKRTPVIPTYLAALTIGRYEASASRKIAGVPVRLWARPGLAHLGQFALDITEEVLPWFERYFGQKYHYAKLDQVAVPGFDAGAMENVGAIFYRQDLLLMAPETASWGRKKRIAEVVAHEIAHQWFGNRVTMTWWDDLWLNEAFATWIANKVVDAYHPDYRMWDEFLSSRAAALEADAMKSTHPIYTDVATPAEATELFDVITYEKGCATVRMLESYLGEEIFRSGIERYQDAYKDSNAKGRHLWDKLEEASGERINELMGRWVEQPGFPLVSVGCQPKGANTELILRQSRFFASREELDREDQAQWFVPLRICYRVDGQLREHRAVMREKEQRLELQGRLEWTYPNVDAAGFFRVQLAPPLRQRLLESGLKQLSAPTRVGLIEDEWELVRSGRQGIDAFLDLLTSFAGEQDYVVLRALAARFAYLDRVFVHQANARAWATWVRALFGAQAQASDWGSATPATPAEAAALATLVHILGLIGEDPDVLRRAEALQGAEQQDPAAVEPNLAHTVVALAAHTGDARRLTQFVETYLQRKRAKISPELGSRYLRAWAYFEGSALVRKILGFCLDGTVPQEQLFVLLSQLLYRRADQEQTWAWLKRHWPEVAPRVGPMGISRLVEATGALPPRLRTEVEALFQRHKVPEAQRALARAFEEMRQREALEEHESDRFTAWLHQDRC